MTSYAYFQKKFVPLSEAKIGIMTNSLHYGAAVFEGIRGNWNSQQKQLYIFRLKEHYRRMHNSCRVMKIGLPYSAEELSRITIEMLQKSGFREDVYIRPLAYKSAEALGVRLHDVADDFFVFAIPWGRYIDVDKAKVGVSSWHRPSNTVIPPQAKVCGVYVNNALAKSEAIENGYDETIMLDSASCVSEGSGENIFLVINGKLVTPAIYNDILIGITRDTVIKLAQDELGIETIERSIARCELYTADECFFTGTAAHITPVAEIDRRKVGNGEIGEITGKLQQIYSDIIKGNNPKHLDWCTPVYKQAEKPLRG